MPNNKAVLLSIRPNWCKWILSGKKTLEVRRTRPKLDTPFKVYIYCTRSYDWSMKLPKIGMEKMNGKVIGEFVCDSIEEVDISYPAYQDRLGERLQKIHVCHISNCTVTHPKTDFMTICFLAHFRT